MAESYNDSDGMLNVTAIIAFRSMAESYNSKTRIYI